MSTTLRRLWRGPGLIALLTLSVTTGCPGGTEEPGLDGGDLADGGAGDGGGLTVVEHLELTITGDTTWAEGEHLLAGSLDVSGGILEVAPCSIIRIPSGGILRAGDGGALRLRGTRSCPITITSSQSPPAPGDWNQIEFLASSDGPENHLQWVTVEFGGGDTSGSIWLEGGASATIEDSTVRHSGHVGVQALAGASLPGFERNTITNCRRYPIEIDASGVGSLGPGSFTPNELEGIHVMGGTIDRPTTWATQDIRFLVESLRIEAPIGSGAHLTLQAGTTFAMAPEAVLQIGTGGGLLLDGSTSRRILITSGARRQSAGDWDQIEVHSDAGPVILRNTHIAFGGGDLHGQLWLEDGAAVTLETVTFSEAGNGCDIDIGQGAVVDATDTSYLACP